MLVELARRNDLTDDQVQQIEHMRNVAALLERKQLTAR